MFLTVEKKRELANNTVEFLKENCSNLSVLKREVYKIDEKLVNVIILFNADDIEDLNYLSENDTFLNITEEGNSRFSASIIYSWDNN